ncbi:MAG: hypothetical protein KKE73_01100 [Proteobacteria bacterium]|nr:hypothetical protein [Pseudomonadota bacterium]
MEHVCFENIRLESGVDYFLYIGEIKAFGLSDFVRQGLERRCGRPFKAIGICPDILHQYPYDNVVVINPWAKPPRANARSDEAGRVSAGPFVAHVCASRYVQSLLRLLRERQDGVYVWMFESRREFQLQEMDGVTLLGPDPELVHQLNDKTWQYETFKELAPVVEFRICQGRDDMLTCCGEFAKRCSHGVFVSCDYSAGGVSSKVVQRIEDAECKFTDPEGRYLVSAYKPHVWDPTVLGVVGNERDVFVAGVADMTIVDGNKFRGSTYPSRLPGPIQQRLKDYTAAVGRKLGSLGFRGIFGCDYIVDAEDNIFFIEVNPRKQGTTMEYCCTLEHLLPQGAANLPALEIGAVLDNRFPENTVYPDPQRVAALDIHWGTFNYKVEGQCARTRTALAQRLKERELFKRVAGNGAGGHVILEHVGADVDVLPGTFMGRVAAVGSSRRAMLLALNRGKKKLASCIRDA